METYSHEQIAALEEKNWWYATRRNLLRSLLSRYAPPSDVALDVGCGVGSNYAVIKDRAKRVIGLDISQAALDTTHAPYDQKVCASVEEMPIPNQSVDFVVCYDVLEHVDDYKAVADIFRVLRPGGTAFITVPAFESLWNENDDYGHHLRRYRMARAKDVFRVAGFEISYAYYWNRLPFPAVWIVARFYTKGAKKKRELKNNLSLIPGSLDPVLTAWMRFENAFARYVPLPFGVSIILVAKKPQ